MAIALESVVKQLTDSSIISAGNLEKFVPPKATPKDGEELLRQLIKQNLLTRFQAQQCAQGRGKALILGNYVILDKIGAGGMGQVFKAEHRRMKRVVAIKMLPKALMSDAAAAARFQREVEAAARLSHPNIVAAYDADEANGIHFLAMEYVDGKDLAAVVKEQGALPAAKAIDYILQVARGLQFAHQCGVIHRDIKPANLLLDRSGVIKVLDMGLARLDQGDAQSDLTGSGAVMGTVDFMSPEQAFNTRHADARSDIYSLGITLYFLLSGRIAYDGETVVEKILAHRERQIPALPSQANLPASLPSVFRKMVAKKADGRYASMADVIRALEAVHAGMSGATSLAAPETKTVNGGQTARALDSTSSNSASGVTKIAQALPLPESANELPELSEEFAKTPRKPVRGKGRTPAKGANRLLPVFAIGAILAIAAIGVGAYLLVGDNKPAAVAKPVTVAHLLESPEAVPAEESSAPAVQPDPAPASQPSRRGDAPGVAPPSVPDDAAGSPALAASAKGDATMPRPAQEAVADEGKMPAKAPEDAAKPSAEAARPPATMDAPASEPPADAREPVPSADKRKAALEAVMDVYKDEYAKAKKPVDKLALAEKLLKQADDEADMVQRFTLLSEVRNLALAGGAPQLVAEVSQRMAKDYIVNQHKLLADSLDKLAEKGINKSHAAELAEAAITGADDAALADQFDSAVRLATLALTAAKRAGQPETVRRVTAWARELTDLQKQFDAAHEAETRLATNTGDAASHLVLGKYLCFAKENWQAGIPHLAAGGDTTLAALAEQEEKAPSEAVDQAKLADGWWDLAEVSKGALKTKYQRRAIGWYEQAKDNLGGLAKTRVEKRLQSVADKPTDADKLAVADKPTIASAAPTKSSKPTGRSKKGIPTQPKLVYLESVTYPNRFLARDQDAFFLHGKTEFSLLKAYFGFDGEGTVAFELAARPGWYIVQRDKDLFLREATETPDLKQAASFRMARAIGFNDNCFTLESVANPGKFLRQRYYRFTTTDEDLNNPSVSKDTTFRFLDQVSDEAALARRKSAKEMFLDDLKPAEVIDYGYRWDDPIMVNEIPSPHGFFLHPIHNNKPARALFNIGGTYKKFEGTVSLRDSSERSASPLVFIIVGDGKELWRSKPVETRANTQTFQVNVTGVERLELQVQCKGESTHNAHAVWCDPKLSGK